MISTSVPLMFCIYMLICTEDQTSSCVGEHLLLPTQEKPFLHTKGQLLRRAEKQQYLRSME